MKKYIFILFSLFIFSFKLHSQTADALVADGKFKMYDKKFPEAIVDFTNAIKKDEPEVQKYLKKLDSYNRLSEFEKADKGVKPTIDKKYAEAYCGRGICYYELKKNEQALKDIELAIQLDKSNSEAYYQRGRIKLSSGKKEEGCMDIGLARSLGNASAKNAFEDNFCWQFAINNYKDAVSKLKLNQFQPALESIEKSLALCPDSARYLVIKGKCFLGLGNLELAFHSFDKAIQGNSADNIDAYYCRGLIYVTKQQFQPACDDFSKVIKLNSDAYEAYVSRANCYEELGKKTNASADYDQMIRIKPDNGLAYFKRALIKQDSDAKAACKDFKKAASLGYAEADDYAVTCK